MPQIAQFRFTESKALNNTRNINALLVTDLTNSCAKMEDVINILDIKNDENVLLWSIPEVVSYEF